MVLPKVSRAENESLFMKTYSGLDVALVLLAKNVICCVSPTSRVTSLAGA